MNRVGEKSVDPFLLLVSGKEYNAVLDRYNWDFAGQGKEEVVRRAAITFARENLSPDKQSDFLVQASASEWEFVLKNLSRERIICYLAVAMANKDGGGAVPTLIDLCRDISGTRETEFRRNKDWQY